MIRWPAILIVEGDPELVYVHDLADWENHPDAYVASRCDADLLIDSLGKVYELPGQAESKAALRPTGQIKSLEEILGLVKAHAASSGACCVAKLYAPSIEEAYRIARSVMDEQA